MLQHSLSRVGEHKPLLWFPQIFETVAVFFVQHENEPAWSFSNGGSVTMDYEAFGLGASQIRLATLKNVSFYSIEYQNNNICRYFLPKLRVSMYNTRASQAAWPAHDWSKKDIKCHFLWAVDKIRQQVHPQMRQNQQIN